MKKRHTIFTVLLAAILSISSVNVSTVKASGIEKITQKQLSSKAAIKEQESAAAAYSVSAKAPANKKKDTSYIPVVKGVTGSEAGEQGLVSIGTATGVKNGTMGKRYLYSQKVEFKGKGTLSFSVRCTESTKTKRNVVYGVFQTASLEDPIEADSVDVVRKKGDHKTVVARIPKSGTYYIGIYTMYKPNDKTESWKFTTGAIYWNGNNRTIISDQKIAVGHKTSQANYFKMKPTETGYITAVTSHPKIKISLCDKDKQRITDNTIATYGVTYGVSKGKTYYVRVYSPANEDGGYTLLVKNRKIEEHSGVTKTKAVELKKLTTSKGTMEAGVEKADWYKITLNSKKSVELLWRARTNSKMKLSLYQGKRWIDTKALTYEYKSYKINSKGKWPAGTYYLKVYTDSAKASGWYTLKWK
ncbi:MAG: hypothetical protein Q4F98_01605 [Lachnospiraceae bacterium]|nr:hypothetical protein [Lachnospiraceae bacterium]